MRQWILATGVAACAAVSVVMAQQAAPSPAPATQSQGADAQGMPAGPEREIAERACQSCRGLDTVESKRGTKDDWTQTVNNMVSRGADVGGAEITVLIDYLAKSFPPATPFPSVPAK